VLKRFSENIFFPFFILQCVFFFQMITSSPAREPKWISVAASPTLVFWMQFAADTGMEHEITKAK
jgi:hypothetical protein